MVRLGTSRDVPLAVQQWDSLIAVNYPARAFGVSRMISAKEARRLCPEVVLQHVATFREGHGGEVAYREDAFRNIGSDKVSLDPYRAESRKILEVMKEALGGWFDGLAKEEVLAKVQLLPAGLEKASVDEVFIDLSPLVFAVLLRRFPELREVPHGVDERAVLLPRPPTTALEWNPEDCLVDLDENETEVDDPDWDDVIMLTGSEIVRSVRNAVWEKLNYTCSGGIARNKMMAKLGSGCHKPNKQTVVRNRAVQNFLGGFKFTKIRMLGGKLGDQVASFFGTEQVSDLLQVPFEQFRAKLDDDTATWLYEIIRGDDRSEVSPRTQIKSMLSAKSFRPSINTTAQAEKWLRIFAADISNRLAEDGVLENRRRPKTITLHHRQGAQVRSRQIPIPASKAIDEPVLFDLGNSLLRQVVTDGNVWPCSNLSLSVGGFEDGVTKNQAIDSFLVRGEQVKNWPSVPDDQPQQREKRRKIEHNGIKRFFTKPSPADSPSRLTKLNPEHLQSHTPDPSHASANSTEDTDTPSHPNGQSAEASYRCPRCNRTLHEAEQPEHEDWHFAKDLEAQEREAARSSPQHIPSPSTGLSPRNRGGRNGRGRTEKGQMRLRFG